MAIYIGADGTVKKVASIKAGDSGVKTVTGGYCGVNGIKRQFFGKPAGISYFLAGDLVLLGYEYAPASNSWTNKSQATVGGLQNYVFGDVAKLTVSGNTFSYEIQPYRYGYIYFNLYAVFDNGRKVRIDKLFENLDVAMAIPAALRFQRTAGGGTWSGSMQIIGKTVTPSGFSSNTDYNVSADTVTTKNAFTIYALGYDRGGTVPLTIRIGLQSVTINGTAYPVKLFV